MNVRVDLNTPITDGMEVVFRSPVDCSQVTGLVLYYPGGSHEFAFADAHGNNVGDIDHLFAENVVVKVILDPAHSMAFVQNADTNAYLEGRFKSIEDRLGNESAGSVFIGDENTTCAELSEAKAAGKVCFVMRKGNSPTTALWVVALAGGPYAILYSIGSNGCIHTAKLEGNGNFTITTVETVDKSYVDEAIGDIETALDAIIAIQNSLIGGDGV